MATATTEKKATGVEQFLAHYRERETAFAGGPGAWLKTIRETALANFEQMGLPGPRHEYWRHTSVKPLASQTFALATADNTPEVAAEDLAPYLFHSTNEHRVVFINGQFSEKHSDIGNLPKGTKVKTLAQAMVEDREIVEEHLAKYAPYTDGDYPFVALNTAFMEDGVFIHVPKGAVIEDVVEILFYFSSPEEALVAHPRNLIVCGENSQVNFVESYAGAAGHVYFHNAVTEVVMEQSAVIQHYKIQRESEAAFHMGDHHLSQKRDSHFDSFNFAVGGRLSRSDLYVLMAEEHVETTLNGVYLGHGNQHIDNHTWMDHAKANCHSYELYKGILDGKSSGVFNGRIMVRQDAQKTDAIQSNHCLLLTDEATINTRPQLEIFADDVKCTHGATIGQLETLAVFYLQSRGIDEETARAILIAAFATEVAEVIKSVPVRKGVRSIIDQRFELGGHLEEIE